MSSSEFQSCSSCHPSPSHAPNTGAKWWRNKLVYITIVYVLVFLLSVFIPFLKPLGRSLWMYINNIYIAIFIGLGLGGLINFIIPNEYVSALLSGTRKRTIFYAVCTGFFLSACSHGILAIAIQLYKKGASPPAVVAFLLASPWANFPLTILMFGFFGIKAFLIILAAIVIAIISGFIFLFLGKRSLIEENPNTLDVAKDFSLWNDMQNRFRGMQFNLHSMQESFRSIFNGVISLANMVLWWIMLGMLLASITAAYLPSNFMHNYMSASLLGLFVTLIIATILEICSEGTAPLAFEIYRQTGAFGNSFVFLMAGVVTDYTEIGLLWANIGRKTALWLPVVTVPQVILLGYIFNTLIK